MPSYSFMSYAVGALRYDSNTGQMSLAPDYAHQDDRVRIDIDDWNTGRYLDGDADSDESGDDRSQDARVHDTDGTLLAEGRIYAEEVYVIEAPDGHRIEITRVEIGGKPVGFMTTEPLEPGVGYDYLGTYNVHEGRADDPYTQAYEGRSDTRQEYSEFRDVPCFGTGTRIATPDGPRAVEGLAPGDLVETRDHGALPVLRVEARRIPPGARAAAKVAPIRLPAGCLGPGRPARALNLSPQHRISMDGAALALAHGLSRAFVPARAFDGWRGARQVRAAPGLAWHHILLPAHVEILAEGLWTESLLAAPGGGPVPPPALPCLTVAEGRALLRSLDLGALRPVA